MNRRKAQDSQYIKGASAVRRRPEGSRSTKASRSQGSGNFPDGREPDEADRLVVPVVGDVQAVGIEVTDVDAAAVRVRVDTADVVIGEETLAGREKMDNHSHDDDAGAG